MFFFGAFSSLIPLVLILGFYVIGIVSTIFPHHKEINNTEHTSKHIVLKTSEVESHEIFVQYNDFSGSQNVAYKIEYKKSIRLYPALQSQIYFSGVNELLHTPPTFKFINRPPPAA